MVHGREKEEKGGKGTSEADQYLFLSGRAKSSPVQGGRQSGQYGIKGKRPLFFFDFFCSAVIG